MNFLSYPKFSPPLNLIIPPNIPSLRQVSVISEEIKIQMVNCQRLQKSHMSDWTPTGVEKAWD